MPCPPFKKKKKKIIVVSKDLSRLPCGKMITPLFLKSSMMPAHLNICEICRSHFRPPRTFFKLNLR